MDCRVNSRDRMFLTAAHSVVLFAAALSIGCEHSAPDHNHGDGDCRGDGESATE